MAPGPTRCEPAIGFLTVLEQPEFGLIGGYLVLNLVGRPLEFHCTAPLKPNRAQEILYGPTLEPFLYGEQIGRALVGQAKIEATALLTDCEPALAVREACSIPAALVLPAEEGDAPSGSQQMLRFDGPHVGGPRPAVFSLGRRRLAAPAAFPDDGPRIVERLAELPASFELREPFERIREAIEEAQKGVR